MTRARPLVTFTVLASAASLAMAGCSGGPSEAATVTRASLTLSQARPVAHEAFVASGKVSTRFKRPVVLRVKSGGGWKDLGRGSTTGAGAYRFDGLSLTRTQTYSVFVPAAKRGGRSFRKAVTPGRRAVVTGQRASAEVLPPVAQGGSSPTAASGARNVVVAHFSPARPGRKVTFLTQQTDGGVWTVAARGTQRVDGTASYVGSVRSGSRSLPFKVQTAASRGAAAVTSVEAVDDWRQTFTDEFSGSSLNTGASGWSYRDGSSSSRSRSSNDPRAVSVADGTLRMQVKADPANKKKLLTGQISTDDKFTFKYGVASARIRFERNRGQHGSFWMQSPSYGKYPGNPTKSGAEVDTVEFFGKGYPKGGLANFLYYANTKGANVKIGGVQQRAAGLVPSSDTWWNSYHVFSVRWTPKGYTFYVDGQVMYSTAKAVSGVDQYLILSLLASDWELKDLDRSQLPTASARQWAAASTMSVDWAKVWETPATP